MIPNILKLNTICKIKRRLRYEIGAIQYLPTYTRSNFETYGSAV